jgi:hypothetical protein
MRTKMSEGLLLPWEIHPALSAARLEAVGTFLWNVRKDVALRQEWAKGDSLWGAGCVAYERGKHALSRASTGEYREWLSVGLAEGHFLIKIGGVPCRFYRGVADQPAPARYATPTDTELEFLQFAFDIVETPTPDYVFRFEVETDGEGFPLRVSLVQVDRDGHRHNPYVIPLGERLTVRRIAKKRAPVKLPAPKVGSLQEPPDPNEKKRTKGEAAS